MKVPPVPALYRRIRNWPRRIDRVVIFLWAIAIFYTALIAAVLFFLVLRHR